MSAFKAKHVSLVSAGYDLYLSWIDKEDDTYHSVDLNIDQVVLILKLSAEIISRCSIVRPIP